MISPGRLSGYWTPAIRQLVLRIVSTVAAIACFVLLLEEAMNRTGFFNQGQAIWWPTNGLALALLLRNPPRRWPVLLGGVLLGSFLGSVRHGYPMSMNLVEMVAAGPLIGAVMLPRFNDLEEWMQEPHLVLRFIAFPLVLAPVVSASFYACCFQFLVHGFHFWPALQSRSVSDMLGYAMFTPLALVLSRRAAYRLPARRTLMVNVLLLAVIVGITVGVFYQSTYPLIFVLASVTLLAALHLGFTGSVIAVNVLAAIATTATMHGVGPFTLGGGSAMEQRILLLQLFLVLTMITVLSIAVIQVGRAVIQDKLELAYQQMEKLATIDALTGLANRRLFENALEAEWARACRSGEPLAILMIDVDNFKSYNDRYGHLAGDDCLREVAHAFMSLCRRSTDLVARFGGEEFVVLLPATAIRGAKEFAELVRSSIEALHGQKLRRRLQRGITVSIGCAAILPTHDKFPAMLIGASDEALYRAKQNGRNRVEVSTLHFQQPERGAESLKPVSSDLMRDD
jgi:diguanylate cyclase (GGDEF)-like protein